MVEAQQYILTEGVTNPGFENTSPQGEEFDVSDIPTGHVEYESKNQFEEKKVRPDDEPQVPEFEHTSQSPSLEPEDHLENISKLFNIEISSLVVKIETTKFGRFDAATGKLYHDSTNGEQDISEQMAKSTEHKANFEKRLEELSENNVSYDKLELSKDEIEIIVHLIIDGIYYTAAFTAKAEPKPDQSPTGKLGANEFFENDLDVDDDDALSHSTVTQSGISIVNLGAPTKSELIKEEIISDLAKPSTDNDILATFISKPTTASPLLETTLGPTLNLDQQNQSSVLPLLDTKAKPAILTSEQSLEAENANDIDDFDTTPTTTLLQKTPPEASLLYKQPAEITTPQPSSFVESLFGIESSEVVLPADSETGIVKGLEVTREVRSMVNNTEQAATQEPSGILLTIEKAELTSSSLETSRVIENRLIHSNELLKPAIADLKTEILATGIELIEEEQKTSIVNLKMKEVIPSAQEIQEVKYQEPTVIVQLSHIETGIRMVEQDEQPYTEVRQAEIVDKSSLDKTPTEEHSIIGQAREIVKDVEAAIKIADANEEQPLVVIEASAMTFKQHSVVDKDSTHIPAAEISGIRLVEKDEHLEQDDANTSTILKTNFAPFQHLSNKYQTNPKLQTVSGRVNIKPKVQIAKPATGIEIQTTIEQKTRQIEAKPIVQPTMVKQPLRVVLKDRNTQESKVSKIDQQAPKVNERPAIVQTLKTAERPKLISNVPKNAKVPEAIKITSINQKRTILPMGKTVVFADRNSKKIENVTYSESLEEFASRPSILSSEKLNQAQEQFSPTYEASKNSSSFSPITLITGDEDTNNNLEISIPEFEFAA